jgi:hypothetical protein
VVAHCELSEQPVQRIRAQERLRLALRSRREQRGLDAIQAGFFEGQP